jgi:hypothetical protein
MLELQLWSMTAILRVVVVGTTLMGGEQRRATAVWECADIAVAKPAVAVSPREEDVQSMLQPDQTRYLRKSSFGGVQGS